MSIALDESRGERIRLVIAYDGAAFHGFARQAGLRTVQGELEAGLTRLLGVPIAVEGSGRTDKGVHARAQVVHFDQPYGPSADRYVHVLKNRLGSDIIPVSASRVDDGFHARFSVLRKTYRYSIDCRKVPDLFRYRFAWNVSKALCVDAMRQAASYLVGVHDFTSFCATSAPQENKVREIYDLELEQTGDDITITVSGSGFLQYMVRIISGTLVDVGLGVIEADEVANILSARDRRVAGRTAPPHGLCLWNVEYPDIYGGTVLDL